MNSTAPRPMPPVAPRFFFKVRAVAAALVFVALMAGGAAAQQAAGGEESAAATKRLFEAVYDNNLGAVQTSIAAGADINATNEQGLMPVDVAVDRGHFRVAHFLLSIRNFRHQKRAEAEPPPPPTIAPPAPAAKALPDRPAFAAAAPRTQPLPAPWPADKPDPFDPAATAQSANLPLVGPVIGPGTAPPVAAAPPQRPVAAPAVAATVEASPEPEPDRPGFFSRMTCLLLPGEEEPAESAAAPPSRTTSDVASAAAQDTATKEAEVPAKTVARAREESPRPAATRSVAAPPLASRKPTAPQTPPATAGNPFDPAVAAPGTALPVIGTIQEPVAAPPPPKAAAPESAAATETATAPSETAPPVPEATGAPGEPPQPVGLFQRLADFLKPEADKVVADEAAAAKEEDRAKEVVETARLPARPAPSVPIPPPPPRLLEGVILTLGETVRLGEDPGKGMEQARRRQPCLKKKEGALVFCVGPVDWPGEIEHNFDVSTFMYHGTQAIARYDKGEATSYYTLFKTDSFDAVTAYYERRFGKPTEIWERRVKPMASAPLPNPTMLWRSVDPATGTISVLEVRKFDDARGGFPDMRRGAILLRREDAQPIFPRLSTLELMSVN